MNDGPLASSFRDPSGALFVSNGTLYRQVNESYREDYDLLISSGLYESLVRDRLLVPHVEVDDEPGLTGNVYKVLRPDLVPFVSYPYEWCFSQLKDAALATLRIQRRAIEAGLSLKDSSAYNIQFVKGSPLLIDTLSFERYREGMPWVAYRQYCQHFLAPLALMSYTDVRLSQLMRVYIDGLPLDLASRLLPFRTRFVPGILTHVHLHARMQARHAGRKGRVTPATGRGMGRMAFMGLLDNLDAVSRRLVYDPAGTEWADYYDATNYTKTARAHKSRAVAEFVASVEPAEVWDLGANTGYYSRVAGQSGALTVSFDVDPAAVEKNYVECKGQSETNILPLVLDLTNPSGGIGWHGAERMSLIERGPADLVLALALVHHLAISNNVPLARVAAFLAEICRALVIEFVPKSDSQVQRLLSSREDVFLDYTQEGFEQAFESFFTIERRAAVPESERTLYLMQRKATAR